MVAPSSPFRRALGRNLLALATVSFLTDVASEMAYPLIPALLATVLGASPLWVGAIEGAAETLSSLLKGLSGRLSDRGHGERARARAPRRKPWIVAGYALASLARPFVGSAQSAFQVLAIRLVDRVGKGLRSSPRDALLADSVPPEHRGFAFGFHRAADHAGALVGPLVAFALLQGLGLSLREVFWWTAVPGALALLAVVFWVKEDAAAEVPSAWRARQSAAAGPALESAQAPAPNESQAPQAFSALPMPSMPSLPSMPRSYFAFLAALLAFTLGNSTDAFLLLRASDLGVSAAHLPLLWGLLQGVKSLASIPGGALSDRLGRRPLIVAGWAVYAAVYLAFGWASETWHVWALFAVYGLYFGLTEGVEKALIADLAPASRRGAAFGGYHLALGVAALPASLLFGFLWKAHGAPFAFACGAAAAGLAALVVLAAVRVPPRAAARR